MTKSLSPSCLVFATDVGFLYRTTVTYKNNALSIKNSDYGACSPSFHLLSSLAFELFPKALIGFQICLKYKDNLAVTEDEIRSEISNEIRKYNHDISKLYLSMPDLMKYLNIKNITTDKNGYVWEYKVQMNKGNKYIAIKDIEAIRYGAFAKYKDIMIICVNDKILVDLLGGLEKYVHEKYKEANRQLFPESLYP